MPKRELHSQKEEDPEYLKSEEPKPKIIGDDGELLPESGVLKMEDLLDFRKKLPNDLTATERDLITSSQEYLNACNFIKFYDLYYILISLTYPGVLCGYLSNIIITSNEVSAALKIFSLLTYLGCAIALLLRHTRFSEHYSKFEMKESLEQVEKYSLELGIQHATDYDSTKIALLLRKRNPHVWKSIKKKKHQSSE